MYQRRSQAHAASGHSLRAPLRLLIESRDPAFAVCDFTTYRAAGFDVTLCAGPTKAASECPLVRGEPCDLVERADVLLVDLAAKEPMGQEVLAAVRVAAPDLPVVAMVPSTAPDRVEVLDGCTPLLSTTSITGQVRALRHAATRTS